MATRLCRVRLTTYDYVDGHVGDGCRAVQSAVDHGDRVYTAILMIQTPLQYHVTRRCHSEQGAVTVAGTPTVTAAVTAAVTATATVVALVDALSICFISGLLELFGINDKTIVFK